MIDRFGRGIDSYNALSHDEGEAMGTRNLDGTYTVTCEEIDAFHRDGFVHLAGLLSEDEVAELEVDYDRFLRREIEVPGKDYCDMAGDYGREPADYSIVNVMLPRRYYPAWQGNVLEQRAIEVATQLQGDGMELDYDQLLAKQPLQGRRRVRVAPGHGVLAGHARTRAPQRCGCAIDDSTIENGCMRFVPATTHEAALRPPRSPCSAAAASPMRSGTELGATTTSSSVPIRRGDCTVHNERVMHGSGGNSTAGFRRAYIVACRSSDTIATSGNSVSPTATTTTSTSSTKSAWPVRPADALGRDGVSRVRAP